jgi:hypothetical protein
MHPVQCVVAFAVFVTVGLAAHAQGPVTATCKDGTTYTGATRSGACGHHGGVAAFAAAAPAAGKVWVNTQSRVYHCPGTQYYGKTKAGAYMTEAAAKAAGNKPDRGKACF